MCECIEFNRREAVLENPSGRFKPFIVCYAETFIVSASVGDTIRPYEELEGCNAL